MKKSKKVAHRLSAVTSTTDDTVALETRLSNTLALTGIAEVISSESNSNQITIKCRVHDEKLWLPIITFILQEEYVAKWEAHVCQLYFIHKGKLVYTWNLTFGSDNLQSTVDDLCRIIGSMTQSMKHFASVPKTAAKQVVKRINGDQLLRVREDSVPGAGIDSVMKGSEVVEAPLVGVTSHRNKPGGPIGSPGHRSKGAHLIGSKRDQYQ